jgi:hypothetical protein
VLQQFADNFAAQVRAAAPGAPGGGGISSGSGALGQAAAVMSTQPAAPLPAQTAAAPLNGLALAWAIFRDWLRSLFAPRKA